MAQLQSLCRHKQPPATEGVTRYMPISQAICVADQGNGVQVADDAVGLDRLVAHDHISSARATLIEPHDGRIVNALRRRKETPDIQLFCGSRSGRSASGPTRTSGHVRLCAAVGGRADLTPANPDDQSDPQIVNCWRDGHSISPIKDMRWSPDRKHGTKHRNGALRIKSLSGNRCCSL